MELIDINNAQPAELRKYLLEQFGIAILGGAGERGTL